ncbi:uncharacterized protein LOC128735210 [Sabethes cyaneus]|uniref:uncharacterized protein LOC128735210 n=1 Tax=Sabethes cyaneus TaxID=53552 RepID=UPI00237DB900|nr:uncharacterized protein LOC128735210 [Sabethes cyaneus]
MEKLICRRNALMAQMEGEFSVAKSLSECNSQSEVKDRLDQLKMLADQFRATQGEIEENQEDPAAIASVFSVRDHFFGMYYRTKDLFEGHLEDDAESNASQRTIVDESHDMKNAIKLLLETQQQILLRQHSSPVAPSGQVSNGSPALPESEYVSNAAFHLNVRLPAITVPVFNGDRKGWLTFKDIYQSTIHNRNDISDSLKMQYLFSYLDGDAKRLVKKFTISSANYESAWDTLCTHYDKKRFTVFSLIREFIDQPSVSNVNSQGLINLATTSDEVVQQLDALGEEFRGRDPWLIHLMLEKLDKETQINWSQKVIESDCPTFEEFLLFLRKRCEALETCTAFSKKETNKKDFLKPTGERKLKSLHTASSYQNQKCAKCSSEHNTFMCEEFKQMTVEDRRSLAQKAKLCFNCLRPFHCARFCASKSVCRTPNCKQRHHSLLCLSASNKKKDSVDEKVEKVNVSANPPSESSDQISALTTELSNECQIISVLPTAVVNMQTSDGDFLQARVLIDSGSQATLVSEDCVNRLKLPRRNSKLVVSGIGQHEIGTTRGVVSLRIASRFNETIVVATDAYVLGKLTSTIPSQRFKLSKMKLLENLNELADPAFNRPASIDAILGSDVFLALLDGGQVKDECGLTVAQRTIFGWIVAGRYDAAESINSNCVIVNLHTDVDLNNTLRLFWEQEELRRKPPMTPTEMKVLEHFKSTLSRDENGRFIVRLPFDDSKLPLGESLTAARRRLRSIQKRFDSQPEFKQEYEAFLQEYLELNHMEEVPADQIERDPADCYYLPHHAVIKKDSSTTKLRVVFDASCPTFSGVSLNDRLLAGPNNNEDLWSVSLRFRSHRIGFCGDVAKMYRQVWVHEADRDYLRILWINAFGEVKHYRLCTVTYGTKTAPFLAIQAMREAAESYKEVYPKAVERVTTDFYVDDFVSGADNEAEAKQLKEQVIEILSSAGFELRKWSSNKEALVSGESTPVAIKISEQVDSVKALGILWYPADDEFGFMELLHQIQTKDKLASRFLSNHGIKWTFIPPSAPHMGGIWEAAVKSAKRLLVAELGDTALTFEELCTVLCQIEACLNSRPLCALSTNPDCFDALTPGHFLIGQPMNLVPEPEVRSIPTNRLDQWQRVQQATEVVWNRWKDEYLNTLQPRGKWRTVQPNVLIDQLVLVKNENAPPTQWELARVIEVHADAEGVVRTVTLKRGQTLYKRPIHKLCILPST